MRLQARLTREVAWRMPVMLALRLGVAEYILHRVHPRDSHYYLFMLGVDPGHQGRGHGGTLLRALSGAADAGRDTAYLETDVPENVALYERHGFQVVRTMRLPHQRNLRMWFMLRNRRGTRR